MTLEISERQAQLLNTLLTRFVGEIKGEIYRTETASYKDTLKQQEEDALQLLAKLAGNRATA